MDGIELETASKKDSTAKADNILKFCQLWLVRLAVCGCILNLNMMGLMILQQQKRSIKLIIELRRHRRRIRFNGRCQLFVRLAVCGWTLNLNIDRGIGDTTTITTTTKTYHINNPMVLYTRREAFNGWYWIRDGIEDRFNGVANIGWFGWQRVIEYFICISIYILWDWWY